MSGDENVLRRKAYDMFWREKELFNLKGNDLLEQEAQERFDNFDRLVAQGLLITVETTAELFNHLLFDPQWNQEDRAGQRNTGEKGGAEFYALVREYQTIMNKLQRMMI